MHFQFLLCFSLQALAAAAAASGVPGTYEQAHQAPCVSLHVVCARGSDEPPGEGILKHVATRIKERVHDSNSVGLDYPATFASYKHSEAAGIHNLTALIHDYVDRCPKSMIALLGYSQGAQVIGDTLYGNTEGHKFNHTHPLSMKYATSIAAVVLMGDPTFSPTNPWDAGTSTRHGIFQRKSLAWAKPYASITRSYCDHGDVYCARGRSSTAHGLYVKKYHDDAAKFVKRSYHRSKKPGGGVDVSKAPGTPHHQNHNGQSPGPNHGPSHGPNHSPSHSPGHSPGPTPGHNPGHNPGHGPNHGPSQSPSQSSGHHPGSSHNSNPPSGYGSGNNPGHNSQPPTGGHGGHDNENGSASLGRKPSAAACLLIPLLIAGDLYF